MQLNSKKHGVQLWGALLLPLPTGVSWVQTMTRQDKIFIQKGPQYQRWMAVKYYLVKVKPPYEGRYASSGTRFNYNSVADAFGNPVKRSGG
ncbi:hypothetical protein [Chitinophaga sp. Ak27]|uniref:hypothetical protein n=1 Tax=Chitinophaga sp. Ak27 TaxID=2726116 RepID=UPI00145F1ADF|nr:hypothetical protein [Chitinophaga sp. Ak27]NLU90464.1 hypothetical protein [Chitinophaga sp. Ak27]